MLVRVRKGNPAMFFLFEALIYDPPVFPLLMAVYRRHGGRVPNGMPLGA